MENQHKLKEFRNLNSLTQEELSKASGISIRTIQRIEKGLSSGSPHTIKALAKALNIDSKALVLSNDKNRKASAEDLNKVRLLNFSILSVLLVPLGNIILPTLIFFFNKKDENVNRIGRKIIGFQMICTPILFFLTILIFLIVGRGNGAIPLPVFICYVLFVSVNILIVIRTSISIDSANDAPYFFPKII